MFWVLQHTTKSAPREHQLRSLIFFFSFTKSFDHRNCNPLRIPSSRKQFFRQGYGAHLPGYTGHCPTLKFRVGKRFGANTEEIMKELLEKKILKTGPYRPNSGKNAVLLPIVRDPEIRRDWKNEAHLYKTPPFVLGYTGYIPGYNNKYGLSFMRAVEEGGREWRETQTKLRLRRDAMRAHVDQRTTPRNMLSRARADNVEIEIDHGHPREPTFYENQVSPERPPIVGYTGHIPGAKGESALSRRYAQAARRGLQMLQREREGRSTRERDSSSGAQRAPNGRPYDET
ncbi:protein FAM166B-like isoform X6 [Venturia canescens]|uniref:protein FAM166B-like isoform X6 n=1 Tax=Venturia canescens TaxID=32260 RepID=UPI001C9C2052|nr:protein FAM166B-like isoform X6 [Venturia canescens]